MKILIVKIGAIGDILMARAMLELAPKDASITWLCGASVAGLVRLLPRVTEIMELDDRALLQGSKLEKSWVLLASNLKLLGRHFDLVITAHSDPRYSYLSRSVRAERRRSFAKDRLVRGRFHGHEYARLMLENDGAQLNRLRYAPLKAKRMGLFKGKRRALLFPGGAKNLLRDNALRRWPLEHYLALSRLLQKKGWSVAFSGAESDAWTAEPMRATGAKDFLGRFQLAETLGLCAEAELVITHDSGPMHLAAASGSRVLALFGPTNPAEFASAYENVEVLRSQEDLACRPCYDGREFAACDDNRCLTQIRPRDVMRQIEAGRAR